MPAYPVTFDHARFPAVPDAIPPAIPPRPVLKAKAGTDMGSTLKLPVPIVAQVEALWLQDPGSSKQSLTFENYSKDKCAPVDVHALQDGADDSFLHFHFLPGIDSVEVRWKVSNIDNVQKLRFEMWCATDKTNPIWSMEKTGGAAVALLKGPDTKGEGPLAWNQIVIPGGPKFPDQCPNVANAPYQLRLTVTCARTGAVTTAWTYFDVLVDSIELHWGPEGWIPGTPIQNVSPVLRVKTTADEKKVLKRLKGQVLPTDPEVTAIRSMGAKIPLRLPSTMAGYIHFDEWFGFAKDFAYLRHRARWGDGPRIPIEAIIYLKRMDDTKLDPAVGGATWNQAGAALGPVRLLWNWEDRNQVDRDADERQRWPAAGTFVMTAVAYKLNTGDEPPGCLNCHLDRGGKRGGPDRIFPNQNGTGTLPFVVAQCADRKWAALSTAGTNGATACKTGVLFNPSRIAKDTYRITVLLANQLTNDLTKPVVDVTGTTDALLNLHPGLPRAKTAMIEIQRQVNARYIRKSAYTSIDLNLIQQSYEVAGVHIEWLNLVDLTFTGLWTQAEYDQYLQAAIAMAGLHYSDQEVPAMRYTAAGAGRYGVQTNRYTQIRLLTVRNLLAQYNHWFGCPTGTNPLPVAPSEVCFTLPSRDKVVDDLRDQAIAAYIAKPRKIKPSWKNRWNRLVAANPMVALPTLHLQLYNSLSAKKKLKIDNETKKLYTAAGWKVFDNLDANIWTETNYFHPDGPVDLLAEMHQLKIAADAYEGVSFFHYINMLQTLDSAGNPPPLTGVDPVGRYYALGGVAKVDTSVDLGLKSVFFVWDHPNDGRRGRSRTPHTLMMNGNITAVHEFGHNLHLTHPFGEQVYNRDMHDKNPPERPDLGEQTGPADQCVMNYHRQDEELCGVCRLRLRGWAFFKNGPLEGFDNTDPSRPGKPVRISGQPVLNNFFTHLT
jgi:hypothetical protein